jgi:hypothetical protein
MKSGTSSLHHYLASHAEICMSVPKEPNYFSKRRFFFHKGDAWYRSLFKDENLLKGESSTAYTKYPTIKNVPERIRAAVPDAKLIFVLRDPVERTISHVTHDMLEGFIPAHTTVDRFVQNLDTSIYVQYSRYELQLRQYQKVFSRDRFLLLSTQALDTEPRTTFARVCAFLEVDEHVTGPALQKRWNVTRDRRRITNRARYKAAKKAGNLAQANAWLEPFAKPSIGTVARTALENYLQAETELVKSVTRETVG